MSSIVPRPTLQRLPAYLLLLKRLKQNGATHVSCNELAAELSLNPVSVRKDIAAVSSRSGRPKIGFDLDPLILDVEKYLGYSELHQAVVVGVGRLGGALLAYPGFTAYGVEIVAAFDANPALVGGCIAGKPILAADTMSEWCEQHGIEIGVLTVPTSAAQEACDKPVAGGVRGIWSFAPTHLHVPDGILVQREDMAIPLAMLSKHLEDPQNR